MAYEREKQLIKLYRDRGEDGAAKDAESILEVEGVSPAVAPAVPAPAAPPETPVARAVPAEVAELGAQRAAGPSPPPGKAPLQSLDEANSLPQAELVARMDEVEWLERQEAQR